jgi:GT2 family glycosyltransferase
MWYLMPEVDLSVVIVNWNSYDMVIQCARALFATVAETSYEIIIVDNSQNESGRTALFDQLGSDVHVLLNPRNVGFAAANNQALRVARGKYVLLLNPDTVPLGGSINGMVDLLESDKSIGMLGCQLVNADGTRQTSAYGLYPSILSAGIDATGALSILRKVTNRLGVRGSQVLQAVAWVKGACLLTRMEVILQIGMLDEQFFLYSEDADWCKRAHDAGWRVVSAKRWSVLHRGQISAGQVPDASIRSYYESYLKFVIKHSGVGMLRLRVTFTAFLLRLAAFTRMVALTCGGQRPMANAKARAYWRFLFPGPSAPLPR